MSSQNPARPRILLADDDATLRRALTTCLHRAGYAVTAVADGEEAIVLFGRGSFDLVVSDMRMPGRTGDDVLAAVRKSSPDVPVLLMSGDGDVAEAVDAIRRGAEDFLIKPFDISAFQARVARALDGRKAPGPKGGANARTRSVGGEDLIAVDQATKRVLALADNVADSKATVLLVGESGTGKERIARYLHEKSDRADGPFVAVNCAAIPENLLESELFGHEKGSFSGATSQRIGKFEQASGGTILLDEISEMDLGLQAKLLRVLQEFEIDRVGGSQTVKVEVRVICTTNRDLRSMVDAGEFREDLYYRIHVFPLRLPPLRDRKDDIPAMAHHFVLRHAEKNGRRIHGLTDGAVRALRNHHWPGNVRDLENTLERAVLLSTGPLVGVDHLLTNDGQPMGGEVAAAKVLALRPAPASSDGLLEFQPGTPLAEVEQSMILQTLRSTGGNRTHTSRLLGISIRTLRNRLREYRLAGIDVHPPAAMTA